MPESTAVQNDPFGTFDLNNAHDLRRLRHALPSPVGLIERPGGLPGAFEVTTIGDIRVDVRSHLHDRRFFGMTTDQQTRAPVTVDVGGTAIGFARAARPHFSAVHVLGALGDDRWTDFIRDRCAEARIDAQISQVEGPNSLVIVLRDQPTTENPQGVRLIVSDARTPYGQLDAGHIAAHRSFIERADALVVDGYALMTDTTAEALDTAIQIAVDAGVPVCFDIVPHRIDRFVSFDQIRPLLHSSSLITTEAHTLLRLLGKPVPELVTPEFVVDLIGSLPDDIAGWQRTWLVRYGEGNMDETTAVSPMHHVVSYHTGYAAAANVAGYGYHVAAAELKWWLTNYARAAAVYPDLAARSERVAASRFGPPASEETM